MSDLVPTAFNGTVSCDFESLTDILNRATDYNWTLAILTEDCPDVCSLAWGEGNPDLSGIGVFTSYILQYVLTIFYGPLFFVFHYAASDNWKYRLEQQHSTVFTACSIFSISVATATLVWLPQKVLLFEVTMMYFLNTMAFLTILCLSMSALGFQAPWYFGDDERIQRCIVIVLTCLLEFALYVAVTERLKQVSVNFDKLPELVSACLPYKSILPGLQKNSDKYLDDMKKYAKAMGYDTMKGAVLWSTLGLPVRIFLGFLCLGALGGLAWIIYRTLKECPIVVAAVCSLAFWIGVTYCLAKLDQKRSLLSKILGHDFADNEWGFGQVLAVFTWMPLLMQMIPGIVKSLLHLCAPEPRRPTPKKYNAIRPKTPPVSPPVSKVSEGEESAIPPEPIKLDEARPISFSDASEHPQDIPLISRAEARDYPPSEHRRHRSPRPI